MIVKRSGFWRAVSGFIVLGLLATAGLSGSALAMGERGEHRPEMRHRMFERLAKRLELTDQQKARVETILKTKMDQMRKIHEQVRPRIEAIRQSTDQEIRALLTPAQQVKYRELLEERGKRMKEWGSKFRGEDR